MAFHLSNLDAPAVALVWQGLFARCMHVTLAWPSVVALGVAVWLIYAADRILDVRHRGLVPSTARHDFHHRRRRLLTALSAAAFGALFVLAFLLRPPIARDGFLLASGVAGYLVAVHCFRRAVQIRLPKELIVAILFAAGTCLAPLSRAADGYALLLPELFFASLCWFNCALIEMWEWGDSGHPFSSRPHGWTRWVFSSLRPLLAVMLAAGALLLYVGIERVLFSAVLLSAGGLLLLDFYSRRFTPEGRRVLADAALLTPLLFLIVPR